MRGLIALFVALAVPLLLHADPVREPDLVSGVQQVKDGDLDGGLATLDEVQKKLEHNPARAPERARAHLYMGIALVGLNRPDEARARFREALALDSGVRLARTEFAPKVLAVFEAARRETAAARPKKSGAAVPLIAAGAGATAAVVALAGGGDERTGSADVGTIVFSDARFATPTIVCPNGSVQRPIPISILVTATSTRSQAVPITQVTATLRVLASQLPAEVGLLSREATSVVPAFIGTNANVTLRVDTALLCHNDPGNAERFNDWQAEVTLISSVATATLTTVDQLRIENP